MGSDLFGRLIHPQDLPVVSAFQSKLENVQDDVVLDYEYRMQDAKGVWHWLHSYERPFLRKPDGTLKQKIGIAIDITERKRIEHQGIIRPNESLMAFLQRVDEAKYIGKKARKSLIDTN